jgi:hypothetical protein
MRIALAGASGWYWSPLWISKMFPQSQMFENESGARSPHSKSALLFALLLLTAGCQNFRLADSLPWSDKNSFKEPKGRDADRMVAVWTDTTYYHPGKAPTRGFGGRVYFYDTSGEAMPVDGQLVVYAYDETGAKKVHQHSEEPDRKYVFTAEQFKRFQSESPLGVSYSIWLPWDKQGGPTKEITLLPMLTSATGKVVRGEQSLNVLPGSDPAESEAPPNGFTGPFGGGPLSSQPNHPIDHNVQQASQRDDGQATLAPNHEQMRTLTLNVPPSMQQRLLSNQSSGPAVQQTVSTGARTPLQEKAAAYFAAQQQQKGGLANQAASAEQLSAPAPADRSAEPPSAHSPKQPQAHFGWPKRRALGEPIFRPGHDRAR